MVHIKKRNSIHKTSGDGLTLDATTPDTLIVDADAFVLSDSGGNGATLTGAWTVKINGRVATKDFGFGLFLRTHNSIETSTLTIGAHGRISGKDGAQFFSAGTVVNHGLISGGFSGLQMVTTFGDNTLVNSGTVRGGSVAAVFASGVGTFTLINSGTLSNPDFSLHAAANTPGNVTNSGTMKGQVLLGDTGDVFTNFKKVGHTTKSGVVKGTIDLGGGNDAFYGGSRAEKVSGGTGIDFINLGGGNDTYLVSINGGGDILNGGGGIDTYDLSATLVSATVNLDSIDHGTAPANTAVSSAGNSSVTGFENATGGTGDDVLYGSAATNVLKGGVGNDHFYGLGGRDIMSGGENADFFHFVALKDSRVDPKQRDTITDFATGFDKIVLEFDANNKTPEIEDFTFTANHGHGKFTHHAGQLRLQRDHGNTIVQGDVNGDGKADFAILVKGTIHDTDFVV